MTQHTPGPWRYEGGINVFADKTIIARVLADAHGNYVREANARLIAAAPDLLAMLVKAHEWLANMGNSRQLLDAMPNDCSRGMMRAAIAKATGDAS